MPNWVFNGLTVEGNPDSVNKLKEQMNKPFSYSVQANGDLAYSIKEVSYSNPIFAFWNIIAPTDLNAYHNQPDFKSDKPYGGDDWYSWNLRNWGVKWDVAVPDTTEYSETNLFDEETNGDNLVLVYRFDTAWGVPVPALEKLSSQYPDLLLTLEYEEETGWGGQMEFLRGVTTELSEYNWKCWECDYEETGEPPYCEDCEFDMCPKCGYGEPTDEDRAKCQTHSVKSEE
jgi:hypothetical protein